MGNCILHWHCQTTLAFLLAMLLIMWTDFLRVHLEEWKTTLFGVGDATPSSPRLQLPLPRHQDQ